MSKLEFRIENCTFGDPIGNMIDKIRTLTEEEIKRQTETLTAQVRAANARERKAFYAGIHCAIEADVDERAGRRQEYDWDVEQEWQQYRKEADKETADATTASVE